MVEAWQLIRQTIDAAKTIAVAIHNAGTFGHGLIATIVSFVVLSLGATGVFSELHTAMNKIWKVRRRQYGLFLGVLKDRFASFTMFPLSAREILGNFPESVVRQ